MIFSSVICFLQKLPLIGANLPQTGLNYYEFIKKRWNTNIDFLGEKGLLRLAAQKESDKTQNGLLRGTNCVSFTHKPSIIHKKKNFCNNFFFQNSEVGKKLTNHKTNLPAADKSFKPEAYKLAILRRCAKISRGLKVKKTGNSLFPFERRHSYGKF
ncbi:MAG: hypothetical protein WC454_03245 [Phycisphaerae bacterium]|jgi:hypothetical protein